MSDASLHGRASALFLELCDLPADRREAELALACAGEPRLEAAVRALLGADADPEGDLDAPAFASLEGDGALSDASRPRIGGYVLGEKLGEGGMGVVWEAWQESPRREVALKLVRFGPGFAEHRRRFEYEAQVLARLNHPAIAQVYGAGVAETAVGPQPYFAMELVRGVPLDTFAASRGLDLRGTLELFVAICDGVQHAHRRGVVHRDLKPGNVLVQDDGRPKVLDFGVARAAEADDRATAVHTATGELIGTLSYMSPEQVRADPALLDVRADVYSLGVLLYELLAGRRPFELGALPLPEALRVVLEDDPPPLAQVAPDTPTDVATIVAKALEKDPARRYGSAGELAEDVRRFLRAEPIHARPASTVYHVTRFVRRNRLLVGSLSTIFLVLCAGLGVASTLYVRELDARARSEDARGEAERQLGRVLATNRTFERILRAPFGDADGREVRMLDVLQNAALEARAEFRDDPEQRAWLLWSLGQTFLGVGQAEAARSLLTEARDLLREDGSRDPLLRATLGEVLGHALAEEGRFREAEQELDEARRALAAAEALAADPDDPDDPAAALDGRIPLGPRELASVRYSIEHTHAFLCSMAERPAEGLEHLERAEAALGDAGLATPEKRAKVLATRAKLLQEAGDLDGAEAAIAEALALLGDIDAGGDHLAIRLHDRRVGLARRRGRPQDGLEDARASIARTEEIYGPSHPDLGDRYCSLGSLLRKLGRTDEAREAFEHAEDVLRRVGYRDQDLARAVMHQGSLDAAEGRAERAEARFDEAAALLEGDDDPSVAVERGFLETYRAHLALESGRVEEAREHTRRALELKGRVLADDDLQLVGDLTAATLIAQRLGEHEEALAQGARCLGILHHHYGIASTDAYLIHDTRSQALGALDRWDEALAEFDPMVEHLREMAPEGAWLDDDLDACRAWCEWHLGREGARERLDAAIASMARKTGPGHFRLVVHEARRATLEEDEG